MQWTSDKISLWKSRDGKLKIQFKHYFAGFWLKLSTVTVESQTHKLFTININFWIKILNVEYFQPREVVLASGRKLTYMYDSHGGLERIMLPRGNVVGVWKQAGLGYTKMALELPGNVDPHVIMLDVSGHVIQIRPAGGDGVILFRCLSYLIHSGQQGHLCTSN